MEKLILMLLILIPTAAYSTEYDVSTGDEFIEAIGPDRTIVVGEGVIVLDDSYPLLFEDPYEPGFSYTHWNQTQDGWELVIANTDDLTITGSGSLGTKLVSSYPEAYVIRFVGCERLCLENLSLGHITGGTCDGGVLEFERCEDVTVRECDLWGSGTVGLLTRDCAGFTFENSMIRDCTVEIMRIVDSSDFLFTGSTFRDNGDYGGVSMVRATGVMFYGCLAEDNSTEESFSGASLFDIWESEDITLRDCLIRNNTCDGIFDDEECYTLIDVEVE